MFEKCQYAPTAVLFPPYCVDFPCNTQSIAASNRLVWRKNPSPSGTFPIFKQGLGGAKRSRSPSAASPVAFCLLFRHGKRRSPPAGGEIPPADNEPNPKPAPSSGPSGHLPPEGKAFWGEPPSSAPFGGTFPPRGRLKKETNHSKVRNPLWNSPPWRATAL